MGLKEDVRERAGSLKVESLLQGGMTVGDRSIFDVARMETGERGGQTHGRESNALAHQA